MIVCLHKSPCLFLVLYTVTKIISIQRYIYKCKIQMQYKYGRLCHFRYERFISFWLRFFDMMRETQFLKVFRNHTMLTPPLKFGTSRGVLRSQFISAGRDRKNITLRIPNYRLSALMAETQLSASMVQCQLPNCLFFKIIKFSGTSLPGMTSSSLQPHFLSQGSLWQWWLSYPFRASVNCTNWLYTWTLNPVSSKPNQTEWEKYN